MPNLDDNSKFSDLFPFSDVSQDDLKIIQNAEAQINENKREKVVLIAYNNKSQQA